MLEPAEQKRSNPTEAFFDLDINVRREVAESFGLISRTDTATDLELSKLWVMRARHLGKLDAFNAAIWNAPDNRHGC